MSRVVDDDLCKIYAERLYHCATAAELGRSIHPELVPGTQCGLYYFLLMPF